MSRSRPAVIVVQPGNERRRRNWLWVFGAVSLFFCGRKKCLERAGCASAAAPGGGGDEGGGEGRGEAGSRQLRSRRARLTGSELCIPTFLETDLPGSSVDVFQQWTGIDAAWRLPSVMPQGLVWWMRRERHVLLLAGRARSLFARPSDATGSLYCSPGRGPGRIVVVGGGGGGDGCGRGARAYVFCSVEVEGSQFFLFRFVRSLCPTESSERN